MGNARLDSVRPRITLFAGKIEHNGMRTRVVFYRDGTISVGCTDVTIEALRELVKQYEKFNPPIPEAVKELVWQA